MTAAIIVAAGSSQRMGFDKLAAMLDGKSVLRRSVDAFLTADAVSALVVVCPQPRWIALGAFDTAKPITRVDGGATRQQSVHAGLAALPEGTTWVAIHDGARPLVAPADINRCIHAAHAHGAATLARRATDTMMRSDSDDFSLAHVDRDHLWCMETPQVFAIDQLHHASLHATSHGITCTDEVSAIQSVGGRVKFVESSMPNPKITTPADLALAGALLQRR